MTRHPDPLEVAPDMNDVLLENDRVRVIHVHIKPGQTMPMHGHPASVIYALDDVKVRFGFPDGTDKVIEAPKGTTMFQEPFAHSADNLADTDMHVLAIELKQ